MSEMISMLNQKAVFGHEDHRLLFILDETGNKSEIVRNALTDYFNKIIDVDK